jgi:CBS domain-containing protein
VTVLLMRRSILTEKVARHGHHLSREYRVDPFTVTRARDIMTTTVQTVPDSMTLHEAAAFLTHPDTHHPSFPVVDAERRVLGIVDPPAVLRWRRAGRHRRTALHELLAGNRPLLAHPDDYLDGLIVNLTRANVAHVAVVAPEDGRLVGYIGWKDLMNVRGRLQAEERERVVFYRVR